MSRTLYIWCLFAFVGCDESAPAPVSMMDVGMAGTGGNAGGDGRRDLGDSSGEVDTDRDAETPRNDGMGLVSGDATRPQDSGCEVDHGECGDPEFVTCTDGPDGRPICEDIDECAVDNGGCGDEAFFTCRNQVGAEPVCDDIDECAVNNGGCGDAAFFTCRNQVGAEPVCDDIDENNGGW